jgi:hypothetical protein
MSYRNLRYNCKHTFSMCNNFPDRESHTFNVQSVTAVITYLSLAFHATMVTPYFVLSSSEIGLQY